MTESVDIARFESRFRAHTPLVLIGVSLVALLGPWLPGADWVAKNVGQNAVLGFCTFLLGLYTLLLWGESLRQHALTSAILKELMEFRNRRMGEVQGRSLEQRLEAARLLLPALSSQDPKVAASARRNLHLLGGIDLGADPAAWQRWLDEQSKA